MRNEICTDLHQILDGLPAFRRLIAKSNEGSLPMCMAYPQRVIALQIRKSPLARMSFVAEVDQAP